MTFRLKKCTWEKISYHNKILKKKTIKRFVVITYLKSTIKVCRYAKIIAPTPWWYA